jgi:nucleotide-binding universal stress UspA family protein
MQSRRVLFAVAGNACPTGSFVHAVAFARVLDAELYVLRVISGAGAFRMFSSDAPALQDADGLERFLAACRRTQQWCEQTAGGVVSAERWDVSVGEFMPEVARRAAELGAAWIAVAPQWRQTGRLVTALARETGLSVLLVRDSTAGTAIVAATDLSDLRYPVLIAAGALGLQLGRPVVALHNHSPRRLRPHLLYPRALQLQADDTSDSRSRLLTRVAHGISVDAEAVVANELDAVEAILREARSRNAELIVVGTRTHSWLRRAVVGSVSSELVDRTIRSVLVTPMLDSPGRTDFMGDR